ncbi:MAG: DUF63 family protein [Candidatus Aenigmatarchaeota archaeon]
MPEISTGSWLQQIFVQPILEHGVAGYNIVNTLVYAIVFALAVFGVYKLLKKLNIAIDGNFVIGIMPFIVLGSILRVVRDSAVVDHWILVSPIIYMFIFVIALVSLLFTVGIERFMVKRISQPDASKKYSKPLMKIIYFLSDYHRLWSIIGILCCIFGLLILSSIGIQNWYGIGIILGITLICSVIILVLYKLRNKSKHLAVFSKENSGILGAHMFDASTTFTALSYFNYYEQHVVSNVAISIVGPIAQFILKIVVVVAVLWALDKYLKDETNPLGEVVSNTQLRNFIKVAILILGFAPGLRNFIRLGLGI